VKVPFTHRCATHRSSRPVRIDSMRLLVIATALLAPACFAQTPVDKTLLVVNGQPIDGKTYYKRLEVLPEVGTMVDNKFEPAPPGYLALSKLIDEILLLQLAKDKGVAPTDAEVDDLFKKRSAMNPDLMPSLEKIGFTAEDYKYDLRLQLAEYKLTVMGINITDQQVEKHYKDNQYMYTLPKRYKLRVIAVNSEDDKKKVDQALGSGSAFGKVAHDLSIDISRANDGQMGEVPEASLANASAAAIKATKKGNTTDWLTNNNLSVKFLVEDVLEQKVVPLDADLKDKVRRTLMLERGRIRNDVAAMMSNMRKAAKIDYKGTIFDDQLKGRFGKG